VWARITRMLARMNAMLAIRDDLAAAQGLPLPPMGATTSGTPWSLRPFDARDALAIAQRTGLEFAAARALAARGVKPEDAARHLNPVLRDALPDPFVLRDMDRAASRIARAVVSGETIGVFGDYDVDGTTSAALLKLYFDAVGAPSSVYLPDRVAEGYGPSIEAFRRLAAEGAKLIITVDCGAAAHSVIEEAANEGLDIVVFDHHLMGGPPPSGAAATVNPNRQDDVSGLVNLCAAAVTFMGLIAVNRDLRLRGCFAERREPDLRRFLDLVALGLVCDVMPMTGLARVIVAQGLKVLGGSANAGLAALRERCGGRGAPSTYDLGFLLGPRINAAGRIGHARLAFELLTTGDAPRRAGLADRLHAMNAERQAIEAEVLAAAMQAAEGDPSNVIVVAGEGWHPGVIGIVAGRLKERLGRPAIVIGLDGDLGKGSGRSIDGVDLGAAVNEAKARGLLSAGGGHAMAAGLSIRRTEIKAFADFLSGRLGSAVERALVALRLDIDAVAQTASVTKTFADAIARAGPYGPGNPEPVFVLAGMRAIGVRTTGQHLFCSLASDVGEQVRAAAFRCAGTPLADALASERRIHVAGRIRIDARSGGEAGQFQILDAAFA